MAAKYIVVASLIVASGLCTDCPNRWMPYNGSCYLFGHENVQFTTAEEYCRQHNAHLVEVDSAAENAFLRDYMRDLNFVDYVWLGMTDEEAEGIWKWYHSSSIVTFTDWAPTEPQNYGPSPGEDCAVFDHKADFKWIDVPCTVSHRALCEIRSESAELVG